jgi:hypothetical protein
VVSSILTESRTPITTVIASLVHRLLVLANMMLPLSVFQTASYCFLRL